MTSISDVLPWSSETLTDTRFARGAVPRYLPRSGSPASRRLPLPAIRPATCVPWPYRSSSVVAPGLVRTEAMTRELGSLAEVRKSGRPPEMPVSRTATPTPLPPPTGSACDQSLSTRVDCRNEVLTEHESVASHETERPLQSIPPAAEGFTAALRLTAKTPGVWARRRAAPALMRTP